MKQSTTATYERTSLSHIGQLLNKDYYAPLEIHCSAIDSIIGSFKNIDASSALYISLCTKLVEKIRQHIHLRRLETVPYTHQLYDEVVNKHDCQSHEDGCQTLHNLRVIQLKDTHKLIKEILYRLQMVAKPLYTPHARNGNDNYKYLRGEVVSLDTKLTELFYLEEAVLLPRIIEAQRKLLVRK